MNKIVIKALWDYDYVMTEIAPMVIGDMKNSYLSHISKRIVEYIREGHYGYAADLLWCWTKDETLEKCKEKIEELAKEIEEGE